MKQGWTYKTFGEVFDLQMGRTPDRKNPSLFGGDNIWVSIRDIDGKYIEDSKEHITNEAVVNSGIKLVKKGTVIMSFKLTVGKCAIARKDLYTNEAIMAFNVNKGFILDSSFLYYYLQGYRWSGSNKAVMGLTLNKATITKQKISIPPLAEQERIVAELDLLSGIIEKKKAQLKAYDQLAQSIFYTTFGDPITNEKGWETKKLEEVCEYAKTRILSNDISVRNYIGVENLLQNCQGKTIASKVPKDIGLTKFIEGDVLIGNIRPYLKKIWLADCQGGCNGDVLAIRRKTQFITIVNVLYLFKCLSTDLFFEFAMQYSKGEKMPRGDKKEIMKYELLLPPLSLQREFAEKVEAIERQKALVQQSIEQTQTLFDYTMDKYFG